MVQLDYLQKITIFESFLLLLKQTSFFEPAEARTKIGSSFNPTTKKFHQFKLSKSLKHTV
jgi:hypothetical protein